MAGNLNSDLSYLITAVQLYQKEAYISKCGELGFFVRILQFWLLLSEHLRSRKKKNKPISLVHYNKSMIWRYLWAIFTGNIICKDSYYSQNKSTIFILTKSLQPFSLIRLLWLDHTALVCLYLIDFLSELCL